MHTFGMSAYPERSRRARHGIVIISILALAGSIHEFLRLRHVPLLAHMQPTLSEAEPACVTIIVPARNEASNIMTCLQGVDQQHGSNIEVFIVDDQSQDETAVLARGYVSNYLNIRIIDGAPLPAGWLGKSWACWQGAVQSQAEWLLFIDADVRLEPGMLASALRYAMQQQLDMLALFPRILAASLSERMVLPAFFYLLMGIYPFERINDMRWPAFALGQCVLIRRRVYQQLGGHASIRNTIIEDVALAQLVRNAGYRIAILSAPDLLSVRMYAGWGALVEGMAKHASVGMGDTGLRAVLIAMRQAFLAWWPLDLLLLAFRPDSLAQRRPLLFVAGCLFTTQFSIWTWAMRRHFGLSWREALLMPAGTLLYFLMAARAMLRLRLGKGLLWRGRALE